MMTWSSSFGLTKSTNVRNAVKQPWTSPIAYCFINSPFVCRDHRTCQIKTLKIWVRFDCSGLTTCRTAKRIRRSGCPHNPNIFAFSIFEIWSKIASKSISNRQFSLQNQIQNFKFEVRNLEFQNRIFALQIFRFTAPFLRDKSARRGSSRKRFCLVVDNTISLVVDSSLRAKNWRAKFEIATDAGRAGQPWIWPRSESLIGQLSGRSEKAAERIWRQNTAFETYSQRPIMPLMLY